MHVIHTPDAAAIAKLVAILVGGQITADGLPGVTPVIAAPNTLGTNVNPRGIMGTYENRCVPVPAFRRIAGCRLRLYVNQFFGITMMPEHITLLIFHVADIVITRVKGHTISICAQRDIPVLVANAIGDHGTGRAE